MHWKFMMLLKMTVGFWDEEVIENMQIKYRATRFDLNKHDVFSKDESLIIATGEAHSLIWLFFPLCSFVTKAGEVSE